MVNPRKPMNFRKESIAFGISLILGACSPNPVEQSPIASVPPSTPPSNTVEKKSTNSSTGGERFRDLLNIDNLLERKKGASAESQKNAQQVLEAARQGQTEKDWSSLAKGFGMAIDWDPSTEALLGYALGIIMGSVNTPDPQETLNAKVASFQEAIEVYGVAVEFSQKANDPLSPEQKQLVESNIACLKAFLNNPNPQSPSCPLVTEALKFSKITN
jgi:hypothetical protein